MLAGEQRALIESKFEQINSLPTLPDIALRINEIISDPEASMRQMESVIEIDPSLSSTILKVVNSSFYGMAREISSLRLALVILGTKEIKNLVLSLAVFRLLSKERTLEYFDYKNFWQHSAATGQIAKTLAGKLKLHFEGEEFVGGLIHDIGKVVLLEYDFEKYSPVLEASIRDNKVLEELEMAEFGFHHGHVGGWLAEQWHLPRKLIEAIIYHVEPEKSPDHQQLVGVVSLANKLSHLPGNNGQMDTELPLISENHPAIQVLMDHTSGMEKINWEEFSEEIQQDVESAIEFVSLSQQSLWQTA